MLTMPATMTTTIMDRRVTGNSTAVSCANKVNMLFSSKVMAWTDRQTCVKPLPIHSY